MTAASCPPDDPEDAGIVAVVTAAVAGPGVGGPLRDGVLAVSNDPVNILHHGHLRIALPPRFTRP